TRLQSCALLTLIPCIGCHRVLSDIRVEMPSPNCGLRPSVLTSPIRILSRRWRLILPPQSVPLLTTILTSGRMCNSMRSLLLILIGGGTLGGGLLFGGESNAAPPPGYVDFGEALGGKKKR